jgi:hypothetical protein
MPSADDNQGIFAMSPKNGSAMNQVVIAVTGHRDIPVEDIPRLKAAVFAELRIVGKAHLNSPLLMLSGLAEGADRLVASCALDMGWSVGAVLPLQQSDYEADFADEASRAEFRELLSRSAWVRVAAPESTIRPTCYRLQGEWMVRHAAILLTLWDGKEENGEGGTAWVVGYFLGGSRSRRQGANTDEFIHIMTRRTRDMGALKECDIGKVSYLAPH